MKVYAERRDKSLRSLPYIDYDEQESSKGWLFMETLGGTGTFELGVVAQDLEAFSKFALQKLIILAKVKDMHTSFSLGEVEAGGALPLGHLSQPP